MKREVSLVLVLLMFLMGFTFFRVITMNQSKEDVVIPQPTPIEIVKPTIEPTPKVTVKPTPTPVVDKVLAIREFTVSRGGDSREFRFTESMLDETPKLDMKGTAYTLSVASCGKKRSHPQYGITRSGRRAQVSRTVAVDPKIIPLGSVLYIKFPEEYSFRDGLYVADDTGGAIKGKRVDIFFGEDPEGERKIEDLADKFGIQPVRVYVLERGDKN